MRKIATEELSAYLDHELDASQERELERRLAESPEAQKELEQLATVVQAVRVLDGLEAPPELHQRIQRILALDGGDTGLGARLKKGRSRYEQFPPIIWALLATVVALGVMTVVIADLLQRDKESTETTFVDDGRVLETAAVDGVLYTLRLATDGGGIWVPEGWSEEPGGPALRRVSLSSDEGEALLPQDHPLRLLATRTSALPSVSVYLETAAERFVLTR